MNNLFSLMLLPIWVLSFSLFSAVDHARTSPPLLSPIAGPVLPKENFTIASLLQPFSANPATMALAPSVVQMTEQQQHHHLDTEQHHHLGTGFLLVIIVVPIVVGSFIVSSICAWLYRRDHDKKSDLKPVQNSGLALGPILSKFSSLKMTAKKGSASMIDYSLLEAATNNFISSNVLGEGGFGCVYMARFDDNFVVAVKKLENRWQDSEREFENEVDLMSRIRHPNLVSLLGFCVHGQSRFLVYEFVHNGTLEEQLHGPSKGSALTWHLRMKIALDAARGLEYLHEHCSPPVIHRDLKSSNILLDSSCNAKLSDFGLAVTVGTQTKNNIKIMGSLGYVAPEYLLDGKLTEKSDVYAFGVILLELLMGRKPVEKMAQSQCQSIVTWINTENTRLPNRKQPLLVGIVSMKLYNILSILFDAFGEALNLSRIAFQIHAEDSANKQAMPQFTDRTKLPHMVDPVIRNTMDLKHLYQVAAIAVLCVQLEPSYRSLIIDVLHSLMPLVPVELGGALRITEPQSPKDPNSCTSGP